MKHASIVTMANGGRSLGQYSVDPLHYDRYHGGWPQPSRLLRVIGHWLNRQRQRQALKRLDDRMLKDIGVTLFDVARETEKPFWRP